ncbi:hypothetical protein [Corallococcus macrosporus]|uniref:hypothetical protein n=1 Tax=Corallococcus macrosporus TaxID=35 RepID=UPI000F509E2A|nr:hypothetical protein [Corallococcus macrosporus]
MADGTGGRQPTGDLNFTTNEGEIYQGGKLSGIAVGDLLNNEIAVRMVLNELNVSLRDCSLLEQQVSVLRLEHAEDNKNLPVFIGSAVLNMLSVVIVGIGVNHVTTENSPKGGGWILGVGVAMSILTAIAPVIFTAWRRRGGSGGGNAN